MFCFFSPKSFGLCKLSFGALVKANILNLLCIGLDGFSMLDWIDLPHSQSSCFYSGLHLFFSSHKKVQKGVGRRDQRAFRLLKDKYM